VVTLEPCLMCLGAALEARVGRIVFAARNPKNGALGGVLDASRASWNHRFSVRAGLLEREAAKLLSGFFEGKRQHSDAP
jgi:tRNA(Ile)-lysidine synthase